MENGSPFLADFKGEVATSGLKKSRVNPRALAMTSTGVVHSGKSWVPKWVVRLKEHGDPWKLPSFRLAVQLRPSHHKQRSGGDHFRRKYCSFQR